MDIADNNYSIYTDDKTKRPIKRSFNTRVVRTKAARQDEQGWVE